MRFYLSVDLCTLFQHVCFFWNRSSCASGKEDNDNLSASYLSCLQQELEGPDLPLSLASSDCSVAQISSSYVMPTDQAVSYKQVSQKSDGLLHQPAIMNQDNCHSSTSPQKTEAEITATGHEITFSENEDVDPEEYCNNQRDDTDISVNGNATSIFSVLERQKIADEGVLFREQQQDQNSDEVQLHWQQDVSGNTESQQDNRSQADLFQLENHNCQFSTNPISHLRGQHRHEISRAQVKKKLFAVEDDASLTSQIESTVKYHNLQDRNYVKNLHNEQQQDQSHKDQRHSKQLEIKFTPQPTISSDEFHPLVDEVLENSTFRYEERKNSPSKDLNNKPNNRNEQFLLHDKSSAAIDEYGNTTKMIDLETLIKRNEKLLSTRKQSSRPKEDSDSLKDVNFSNTNEIYFVDVISKKGAALPVYLEVEM